MHDLLQRDPELLALAQAIASKRARRWRRFGLAALMRVLLTGRHRPHA